jgi:uncharacterized glyoxalase superfamily protein PhnB
MAERSAIDQLDGAVAAIIAQREADLTSLDPAVASLVQVARELRGLPTEEFKTQLRTELTRRGTMSTPKTKIDPMPKDHPPISAYKRKGFHSVTPYLTVEKAPELIEFVKQAFGATEVFRTTGSAGGIHAEVRIGESMLMIGGGPGIKESPTAIHLYLPDVDTVYERALQAGATSLFPPSDHEYGERSGTVQDPTGNRWYIATAFETTDWPEELRTVTLYFHPIGAPGLIEFLKNAFGAEEVMRHQSKEGYVYHAKVRIGDSIVEMGEARDPSQPMPTAIYLYVEDVDAMYERAIKAGGTSVLPPTDQPYGDRNAWVNDPFGNVWYLATTIAE